MHVDLIIHGLSGQVNTLGTALVLIDAARVWYPSPLKIVAPAQVTTTAKTLLPINISILLKSSTTLEVSLECVPFVLDILIIPVETHFVIYSFCPTFIHVHDHDVFKLLHIYEHRS